MAAVLSAHSDGAFGVQLSCPWPRFRACGDFGFPIEWVITPSTRGTHQPRARPSQHRPRFGESVDQRRLVGGRDQKSVVVEIVRDAPIRGYHRYADACPSPTRRRIIHQARQHQRFAVQELSAARPGSAAVSARDGPPPPKTPRELFQRSARSGRLRAMRNSAHGADTLQMR